MPEARAASSVDVELVALGVLHSHRVVIEAIVAQGAGDSGPEIGQPPGSLQSMTIWKGVDIVLQSAQQRLWRSKSYTIKGQLLA